MSCFSIRNACDALYIATQMEKRAIRLYECAAQIWTEGDIREAIQDMLRQERQHLMTFSRMLGSHVPPDADALLLSALGAGILYAEGLTSAAGSGAFDSPKALLSFAAGQEKIAVDAYSRFAQQCDAGSEAQAAFLAIAQEEGKHLSALENAQAEQ